MSLFSVLAQTSSEINFDSFDTSQFTTTTTTTTTNGDSGILAGILGAWLIVVLVVTVLVVVSMWKLFKKAGKPGWAAIVPIYNTIVLLEIVGRPIWWIFLMLIPFVNFVVAIIVALDLAKSFGKSAGLGIVVAFFPVIGYPILAFGDAKYVGPAAPEASAVA